MLLIVCRLIVCYGVLYIMEGYNYGYCKSFWQQLEKI